MNAPITPRNVRIRLSKAPSHRYWFGGNAVATHRVNCMHLIFPQGERFFIRSVRRCMDRIEDPTLRERARHFYQQEAHHGREHDQAIDLLRAQGFEVDAFLVPYQEGIDRIERWCSADLCLAMTAALEHFLAALSHHYLTTRLFERATPEMRDLLSWHFAEEIEHKSVAFDVFQAVSGRWTVRCVGLLAAMVFFMHYRARAMRHLTEQDPAMTAKRRRADQAELHRWGITGAGRSLLTSAARYLRRDFHPDQVDDRDLARAVLQDIEQRYAAEPT